LLDEQDQSLLRGHVEAIEALIANRRPARTPAQERFIRVIRAEVEPETQYEHAYKRFIEAIAKHDEETEKLRRATWEIQNAKTAIKKESWKSLQKEQKRQLAAIDNRLIDQESQQRHLKSKEVNDWGIPEFEEGQPRPGWKPLGRFQ